MPQILEREVPLYKIKCYGDYLYRVTKRLFNPNRVKIRLPEETDQEERPVGKFDSALSRARNTVREICLCNRWEYFVTLTFDKRWDRYNLELRIKELMQWIQNLNKQGANIKYVFVPEFHEDGAVHLHGLVCGIRALPRPDWWPASVNRKEDGSYYDYWPEFSVRYGFSSVDPIEDPVAVGFYCSKYITKTMAARSDLLGVHTYYRSKGLQKALEVGSVYHGSLALDKCCKFSNSFYSFGFCKFDDVGAVVDLCDEVGAMYQNYVITDPVSGEMVGFFGGDSEDEYIQEMIAEFKQCGMKCSVYDVSD